MIILGLFFPKFAKPCAKIKQTARDPPLGGPVIKIHLALQGTHVPFLGGELRPHLPRSNYACMTQQKISHNTMKVPRTTTKTPGRKINEYIIF